MSERWVCVNCSQEHNVHDTTKPHLLTCRRCDKQLVPKISDKKHNGRRGVNVGDQFITEVQETGKASAWADPCDGPIDVGFAVDQIRAALAPIGLEDVLITAPFSTELRVEVRKAIDGRSVDDA